MSHIEKADNHLKNKPLVPKELIVPWQRIEIRRRRAVVIGISYAEEKMHNSLYHARDMTKFLHSNGYEVLVLTDGRRHNPLKGLFSYIDPVIDFRWPTKVNIIKALDWLLLPAQPGDVMFLYFSGYGASIPDVTHDEEDRLDEAIFALDDQISDDLLYVLVSQRVPPGSILNAFFDCNHSGSILDLPFVIDRFGNPYVDSYRVEELPGTTVQFSATADDEKAQYLTPIGHGLLTSAFLQIMPKALPSANYLEVHNRINHLISTVPLIERVRYNLSS